MKHTELLEETKKFWNLTPCDGHDDIHARMKFRYSKEPWLPNVLNNISKYTNILEVGCGQGTDSLFCCQRMKSGSRYIALDYSSESIERAKTSALKIQDSLNVIPEFLTGNAESLEYDTNSFECIVSIGVLHHTPDTQKAINEIYRVLEKNGRAYIFLYRLFSPKLLFAYVLRAFSKMVDMSMGKKNVIYKFIMKFGTDHSLGTMILECLGVPILRSYTKGQILKLFESYNIVKIKPVSFGFSLFGLSKFFDTGTNWLGSLWMIEVSK